MIKLKTLFLLTAMGCAMALSAQSRQYMLDVYVSNPMGSSMAGVHYNLHTDTYDMDYSETETVLDASGHSAIRTYGGQHTLRISMEGMKTYTTTFDMTADRRIDISLSEDITAPYAVTATLDHDVYTGRNNIDLSWNSEEAVFFDDFESYSPFSIDPQPWTGLDLDLLPTAQIDGDYPNRGAQQYITIVNPSAVNPAWDLQYYYTLAPRSGRQYAGFVQPTAGSNNDWFISPAITVGEDNTLRFYMRVADAGEARLKVGITTAQNPQATDFLTISEGNFLSPGFEDWQEVKIPLAKYAGQTVKIGINCTSRNGALITMIDDFFVGRINEAAAKSRRVAHRSPGNPNESFIIRMNGTEIARTEDYNYTIQNVADGTHSLSVQAVLSTGMSDITETSISVDSNNYASLTMNVTANNALPTDGLSVRVCGEEEAWSADVAASKARIISLPKGVYGITIEADGYLPISQEVTLDGNKNVELTLIEDIVAPFNITADMESRADGTTDVTLNWNRDLGFVDSFEDYPDFKTGDFGGWSTLNFNGEHQTSYPISFGGSEITFPGCSTSSAPTSVPPMVFNPLSTRPSLRNDEAFLAPYGDKYLAFMGPQQTYADKWAITPQMKIYDHYQFSMVAKAYPVYPETIELLINTVDREPANFQLLDRVTLSYNSWMKFVVDLSDFAGQTACMAIRCVTHDGFVAQIDDVRIEPNADMVAHSVGFVQNYDVRLDGASVGTTEQPTFILPALTGDLHTVGIRANYRTGSSEETQYMLSLSGVNETPRMLASVRGSQGGLEITAGCTTDCTVATAYGTLLRNAPVEAGTTCMALPAGIYLVRLDSKTFKVVVR